MTSSSRLAPFAAPFVVFMLFLSIVDATYPNEHYLLYPVKSLLVAGVIAWYWRELPSLKPAAPMVSVAVGVLGVVLWVGMEPFSNMLADALGLVWNQLVGAVGLTSWATKPVTQAAPGLNPFALYPAAEAWALFACRVAGIALVVPVMEELFWRGFLMRWLIREDFTAVPLGTYRPLSFLVTTIFFASVHGTEWPQGLVVGVIYGAWFVRTKSLGSIMLAHGVTNLLLAFYCLATGQWHFLACALLPSK
jgi:membrane protease YdiL (CAAX protease family)